jgi:hypothetical protein
MKDILENPGTCSPTRRWYEKYELNSAFINFFFWI